MAHHPIVAVEIGTSRTVVMTGVVVGRGQIRIEDTSTEPTAGMCKGGITSLPDVHRSLQNALDNLKSKLPIKVMSVMLGVSDPSIISKVNDSVMHFPEGDHLVTGDDLEEVNNMVSAVKLPAGYDLMHSFPLCYSLNDRQGIVNPINMRGASLGLKTLSLGIAHDRADNLFQIPHECGIDVEEAAFTGLTAAQAVLNDDQKQRGVAVIDLGGGTTKYVVCEGGMVTTAGILGVGGDHVTNDLAIAFKCTTPEAEAMKLKKGSAVIDPAIAAERYSLPKDIVSGERSASVRAIQTVVNARMDEIFRLVRAELNDSGALDRIGAGVVITGGGAQMPRVCDLAGDIFGCPAAVGVPVNVRGLEGVANPASLASAAGLVMHGASGRDDTESLGGIGKWFKGFFES